jgi:hypothetical protein
MLIFREVQCPQLRHLHHLLRRQRLHRRLSPFPAIAVHTAAAATATAIIITTVFVVVVFVVVVFVVVFVVVVVVVVVAPRLESFLAFLA